MERNLTTQERLDETLRELSLSVSEWEAEFGMPFPGHSYTLCLQMQAKRLRWELLPAPRPVYRRGS